MVGNVQHQVELREQLAELNPLPTRLVLESEGQGTAAAVHEALTYLPALSFTDWLLITPGDHWTNEPPVIPSEQRLHGQTDQLYFLTVEPRERTSDYGYLYTGDDPQRISRFEEKPDSPPDRGRVNSGVFLIRHDLFATLWTTSGASGGPVSRSLDYRCHDPGYHQLGPGSRIIPASGLTSAPGMS